MMGQGRRVRGRRERACPEVHTHHSAREDRTAVPARAASHGERTGIAPPLRPVVHTLESLLHSHHNWSLTPALQDGQGCV